MSVEISYRHHGTGLVRATAAVITPTRWPRLDDDADCRCWIREVWPDIVSAVRHASPVLASRIDTILAGGAVSRRDVRRATLSVVRYVQRFGRSTPFGLFAGVCPASVGARADVRFGTRHRPVARADHRWLDRVIERLERCPGLLAQLDVVFTDAAQESGGRLTLAGSEVISIRCTSAVALVRTAAASPIRFQALVDMLAAAFPQAGNPSRMLFSLLDNRFLVTSLRAPSTIDDPLAFLIERLQHCDIDDLPVAPLVHDVTHIHRALEAHNNAPSERARIELATRMTQVDDSARVPLSVDLRLDGQAQLPGTVARDMERAASVLAQLVREHTGSRPWRDYFAAFCERFGTGTLVPLRALIDPDLGLGWPRGYPGSPEASGKHVFSERDRLLLEWASGATARGDREIALDDFTVELLANVGGEVDTVPPHIDLGARIHAASRAALDRGEYTMTLVPGRAAGTLTSRLASLTPEAGLDAVFAAAPTTTTGALPVQLSFTPMFPSAENVSRTPACLPQVLSVGEHPAAEALRIDDLAITATTRRLHLVSLSRRQVVEPLVLHALASKQRPPLARLLGELARAVDTVWIGFDWGVAEALPFRPRVRYGRAILSAARWRVTQADLHRESEDWDRGLDHWRRTHRCPSRVQLRDFDQLLPLDLDVPAHRAVLYQHLRAHGEAILIEAPDPNADGWLDGHAHTVVLPLTSRKPPAPAPNIDVLPELGREHGQLPGSPASAWLYVKLYVAEHRINPLVVHHLPVLLDKLGNREYWFVRYPQAREGEEPDHLRLRIRTHDDHAAVLCAVTEWADQLRVDGMLSRVAFDTYYPEEGRYVAIEQAETVFAADSRFVLALLTHQSDDDPTPFAITALSMFDVAAAFLGDHTRAADWFRAQEPQAVAERGDVEQVTRLARGGMLNDLPVWRAINEVHKHRWDALAAYRLALPDDVDIDSVLHALLHMHHNRILGVDRDRETVCLRLARKAAATWRASRTAPT